MNLRGLKYTKQCGDCRSCRINNKCIAWYDDIDELMNAISHSQSITLTMFVLLVRTPYIYRLVLPRCTRVMLIYTITVWKINCAMQSNFSRNCMIHVMNHHEMHYQVNLGACLTYLDFCTIKVMYVLKCPLLNIVWPKNYLFKVSNEHIRYAFVVPNAKIHN